MKVSYIPYDGREKNDLAFSDKNKHRWTYVLKNMLEEEGSEIHTYDILPLEEADAILSFDNIYFQNVRHFWKLYKLNKLGCTTHIDYEPPSANCKIHSNSGLKLLANLFKSLVTYNDDVIDNKVIIKGNIGDYYYDEVPYEKDFKNRKLVCMVANYRIDMMLHGIHPDELYSKRAEAVMYFQKNCVEFDLYGNYWPETHKSSYVKPVSREEKLNVINKYKFLISYDSIKNQNGYISEKIFDCFKAKTIPVYWGADNIEKYIPKNCFIDKREFENYDDLLNYLNSMTEEEYEFRIREIEKYLKSDIYNKYFSSVSAATVLYKELKKKKRKTKGIKSFFILSYFELLRKTNIKNNYDNYYYNSDKPKEINIVDIIYGKQNAMDMTIIIKNVINQKYKMKLFVDSPNSTRKELRSVINKDSFSSANVYTYKIHFSELYNLKKGNFFIQINDDKIKKVNLYVKIYSKGLKKYFGFKFTKTGFITKKYYFNIFKKSIYNTPLFYPLKIVYRLIKFPLLILQRVAELFL